MERIEISKHRGRSEGEKNARLGSAARVASSDDGATRGLCTHEEEC